MYFAVCAADLFFNWFHKCRKSVSCFFHLTNYPPAVYFYHEHLFKLIALFHSNRSGWQIVCILHIENPVNQKLFSVQVFMPLFLFFLEFDQLTILLWFSSANRKDENNANQMQVCCVWVIFALFESDSNYRLYNLSINIVKEP